MKTVSGAVLSSKPVSLSKAAKILSKFASADNGASPAYVHYLKRASESFEEVVQLHRDLRASASEHKSNEIRSSIREEAVNSAPNFGFGDVEANGVVDGERHELGLNGRRDEVKKKKKKKEGKKGRKDWSEDGRGNGDVGVSKEPIEVANGISNGVKKMKNGSEEIADSREGEKERKQSKKRKSEEMSAENGEVNGSAEKRLQHKKRKKSKGGVQV